MKKKLKQIPKFESEDEERKFWSRKDSIDYVDWDKAILNPKFSNLKYSYKSNSKSRTLKSKKIKVDGN